MKSTILTITGSLILTGFSFAGCKDGACSKPEATTATPKTGGACTVDGTCEAGTSVKDLKDGSTKFAVSGMTCDACSGKVTKALEAIDGVTVKKVCHKTGCVSVKIDETKATKAQVAKAISDTGFKVAGEEVSLKVSGMTCSACSDKLTKALTAVDGVTVKKVCAKTGCVDVVVDGDKAKQANVEAAIATTGFKVDGK